MVHSITSTTTETDPLLPSSLNISPLTPIASTDKQFSLLSTTRLSYLFSIGVRAESTLIADASGESFDNVPSAKRRLGLFSATGLIFNRVIGTGIFATPSLILHSAGSVGVALLMWIVGALIAFLGTTVYIEFGTGLPRSGGEKNYLEYVYQRPRFLMSCVYICYALLTGSAASNGVVFGEYVVHSLTLTPTAFNTRFVAFLCLTFTLIIHGAFLKVGIRLLNTLALLKLIILTSIAGSSIMYLFGVPGFTLQPGYERSRNFEWHVIWQGSSTGTNALITALYNIIWSYVGYNNANYALSEIRDPVRTIKRAVPLAMLAVTLVYMLINIAFFAVVSKADILSSRRIAAALFFRNLFGPATERVLSVLIALSTLGSILAGQFTQGRVVQELGREGILPYSSFFASNKPFNAPFAGMLTQYTISMLLLIVPPPGDAYHFLIKISSYSMAIINMLVSVGLVLLHTPAYKSWGWNPPFQAPRSVVVLFLLSNVFLVLAPLVPPAPGSRVYDHLPYWLHVAVSWGMPVIGLLYWSVWCVWLPQQKEYRLEREWVLQDDGVSRFVFQKVPVPTMEEQQSSNTSRDHKIEIVRMSLDTTGSTSMDNHSVRRSILEGFGAFPAVTSSSSTIQQQLYSDQGRKPRLKTLPSGVIWDEAGLWIYDVKSQTAKYYPFHSELTVLKRHGAEIASSIFATDGDNRGASVQTGVLIEIGAGSLKKVKHLLAAIQKFIPDLVKAVAFYALDVNESELERTLSDLYLNHSDFIGSPDESNKIEAKGIYANYYDDLHWMTLDKLDPVVPPTAEGAKLTSSRHVILFMGTGLGNIHPRTDAESFLRRIVQTGMRPGDMMLIGLDHCQDAARVLHSYCDIDGLSTALFRNGIRNAAKLAHLEEGLLVPEDFDFRAKYNREENCHEDFVCARRDISFTCKDESSQLLRVEIAEGELIRMAVSHKYSVEQSLALFTAVGLRWVKTWMDDERIYSVNLLQKPT